MLIFAVRPKRTNVKYDNMCIYLPDAGEYCIDPVLLNLAALSFRTLSCRLIESETCRNGHRPQRNSGKTVKAMTKSTSSAFQEDVPMAGNESANESDVPPLAGTTCKEGV